MNEQQLRRQMCDTARELVALGLNRGASGNVGARCGEGFLVTPSGLAPAEMAAADIVAMDFAGHSTGRLRPSSEWRFHRDILAARPEIAVVIHTHSTFATTLACLGREVPPFHYMIAAAGGHNIRCAPYAIFGSQALSDRTLEALEGRTACLLGTHGMIALGKTLPQTLTLTLEVEALCEQYWRALQIGPPNLLSDAEMARVLEKFKGYGQPALRD